MIFFLFLLVSLSFTSSFGIVDDFTTNMSLYHKDDPLNISGNVSGNEIPNWVRNSAN